jgi:hypothetical protein
MTGFDAVCFSPDGTNIVSGGDHSAVVGFGLWGATMPQGDRRRGKSERQSERQSERDNSEERREGEGRERYRERERTTRSEGQRETEQCERETQGCETEESALH